MTLIFQAMQQVKWLRDAPLSCWEPESRHKAFAERMVRAGERVAGWQAKRAKQVRPLHRDLTDAEIEAHGEDGGCAAYPSYEDAYDFTQPWIRT